MRTDLRKVYGVELAINSAAMVGEGKDVTLKIKGDNYEELQAVALDAKHMIYRYYSDIFDLFDKLEKEMVGTERAAGNWDSILDLIYYNNVFYKVFLVKEYHSEYLETIIRNIQDNLLKIQIESRKPFDRSHLDYALEYARWGVIGLIKKWVDHDCPESPDVIADIIRGLSGMLE